MKKYFPIILFFFPALVFFSCQKVVNIDLNSADPKIVVEANITDQPGPYTVKLSSTVNFSASNVFPPATAANVVISDNANNSETLTETSAGTYVTSTLQGVAGRTYTLTIHYNGNNFTAISSMPQPVNLDSLTQIQSRRGGIEVQADFQDPTALGNYYRFYIFRNGLKSARDYILEDRLRNGMYINYNLGGGNLISAGDSVTVQMLSVDKAGYDYFNTLDQLSSNQQPASPANPVTNVTGGALGYFSAGSLKSKYIIIH